MQSMGILTAVSMDTVQAVFSKRPIRATLTGRQAVWREEGTTMGQDMIYRELGRSGEQVSAIGLGGFHLAKPEVSAASSERIVRSAVDRGITLMDNSWDYHEGESERRMGRALLDGYRGRVFRMTKFDGRSRTAAATQLEASLRRLKADCIDLVQHHEVIRFELFKTTPLYDATALNPGWLGETPEHVRSLKS